MEVRGHCSNLYGKRLSGVFKPHDTSWLQRFTNALSCPGCRMGYGEKHTVDTGSGQRWLIEKDVVEMPARAFISISHPASDTRWLRLPLLHRPQGPRRIQRLSDKEAGACIAVASKSQRAGNTADGDRALQPQCLVAMSRRPCVESTNFFALPRLLQLPCVYEACQ